MPSATTLTGPHLRTPHTLNTPDTPLVIVNQRRVIAITHLTITREKLERVMGVVVVPVTREM